MFAVEEGRTKVLVTGDFRCHGLGWAKAASGLKGAARGARWLVCLPAFEWLGGGGEEANPFTPEEEVGERASRIIRDSPLAFAVCNPSNLDRISGLLKASRRSGAGRLFIVDSYQMAIMDAAREFRDPSGGARYSFKGALRLTGRESEADFALWKEHGFLMLVRESCFFRRYLERFLGMPGGAGVGHGATITGEALEEGGGSGSGGEDGAVILYSQWRGFREGGRGGERGVAGLLAGWKGRTILVSTGGHASPGDLARLAADFCPKARIVPVDCGCSEGIKKAFPEKDKVVDLEPGRYLALD
jgi:hypothetical protein